MTKPYYNPKTKETYLKWSWMDNGVTFVMRALTGRVVFCVRRQKYIIYNQFGEEVRQ